MADQTTSKTISLRPSWKNHILLYTASILLIPVFGIGLAVLYWARKKQHTYSYTFSDTQVTSRDQKYERHIDLVNIDRVEVEQSWVQQKMGVGDIILYTSASSMTLRGMEEPLQLQDMLEKAIYAQKERRKEKKKTEPREPDYEPGTMDKMDYLTGLWQQGLVSDEDFEEEKKHFE